MSSQLPWASESIAEFIEKTLGVEVPWIVDGLIPEGDLVLLLGAPKQGKTLLAESLALSVASGRPFAGQFEVRKGGVLLILEEDRREEVRSRLEKLAAADGLDLTQLPIRLLVRKGWRLDQDVGVDWLKTEIKRYSIVLTVVDCLSGVHRLHENDRDEMGPLLRSLQPVLDKLHCAILFTHHVTKPGKEGGSSGIHSARGSGELAAIARSILHVTRTAVGWKLKVMGNYDPPDPFKLALKRTEETQAIFFVGPEAQEDAAEEETVLALVTRDPGLTTEEIRKRLRRRASVVVKELEDLERARHIERRPVTRETPSGQRTTTGWFARIVN